MGAPKRQRKKFSKPTHPWQKERILAEQELLKDYGLNRKYEIWKMSSILKNFTRQAKNLITTKKLNVEKERNQLLTKLSSLGLINKNAKIEDVLALTLKDIMERRLQTLVCRKNMARSFKQARQFIVHEHISLGNKTITAPSYLVPLDEEASIQFAQNSVFSNVIHPERAIVEKVKKQKKAKEKDVKKVVEKETKSDVKEKEEKKEKAKDKKKDKRKVPSAHDLKKHKDKAAEGKKDVKEEKKTEVKEK